MNTSQSMPAQSIHQLNAINNKGEEINFNDYQGRYLLLTNTASQCGYTPQYLELQQLQDMFPEKLVVIAFPANNFGSQEPGDDEDIATFCSVNYGVNFPIMQKSEVVGENKNPVYAWLTDPEKNGWNQKAPNWNFCKYLVNPEGSLLGFYESGVSPLAPEIVGNIV